MASKALLDALKAELQGLRKSPPQGCPPPLVVSQGHYPLSTMDAPTQVTGPLSLLRHLSRSAQSMQVGALAAAGREASGPFLGVTVVRSFIKWTSTKPRSWHFYTLDAQVRMP